MPLLTEGSDKNEWVEPDEVPRPFVAYGMEMIKIGVIELAAHRHIKGQIMFVQRGALSCEVEGGLWIVPPRSAIWIPGGALHAIRVTGVLAGYDAFMDPAVTTQLPQTCCAISVTPLLRELLARAASLPLLYDENPSNARLWGLVLDELAVAPIEHLHLPMPVDPRLRRIVDQIIASPADHRTIHLWAARSGLSERTLGRLISRETGLSFGRWQRQLGVMLAVKWLAGGASIQNVAADLGYESVPSFMNMFKKTLGTSPGRYMSERHPRPS
ncbi:helix-turn-helix transcriptional regulator [Sphingomonas sp. QA11]|uniref:AraC family transcriptional regulator n=1 Tax=Sphingomonas sp. QA11 TaxID=2950605 RepID=UPI002348F7B3|nr:helix-turn-helix transcriptional regulator [Sphingomonas sp. QA11]WCM25961.1 helix-turn-helix transcriptional regulator [Sphingomonas sp. QA11]